MGYAEYQDFEIEEARDIREGSFMEFAAGESYVSPAEKDWLRWVKKVERLIGHSLDGDQEKNGYSLDYAFDVHMNGETAESYAAEIVASPLYRKPVEA